MRHPLWRFCARLDGTLGGGLGLCMVPEIGVSLGDWVSRSNGNMWEYSSCQVLVMLSFVCDWVVYVSVSTGCALWPSRLLCHECVYACFHLIAKGFNACIVPACWAIEYSPHICTSQQSMAHSFATGVSLEERGLFLLEPDSHLLVAGLARSSQLSIP